MATTLSKTATWELIHEQRGRIAEMLAGFDDDQWQRPSLCAGWRVRDVVAHCVETNLMTPPRFMGEMATTGFRFNAMTGRGVNRHAQQPVGELLGVFRETMGRNTAPPGPLTAMLAEAVIHGEDMARPAQASLPTSATALLAVADFVHGTGMLLHGKERSAGLCLRATDVDWRAGDGPEVSGPAASLIIAMSGRKVALADLTGEGVSTLATRL